MGAQATFTSTAFLPYRNVRNKKNQKNHHQLHTREPFSRAERKPSARGTKTRAKRTTRGGRGAAADELTGPFLSLVPGRCGSSVPSLAPGPGAARTCGSSAHLSASRRSAPRRPYLEHFAESPIAQLSYDLPELLRVQVSLDVLVLLLFFLAAQLEDLPKVEERHLSSRCGAGLQAAMGGGRRGPSARLSRPGRSQPGPPGALGAALAAAPRDGMSPADPSRGAGGGPRSAPTERQRPGSRRPSRRQQVLGCALDTEREEKTGRAIAAAPRDEEDEEDRRRTAPPPARCLAGATGPRCPGVTARKRPALPSPRYPSRPGRPSPPSRVALPGRRRFLRGGAVRVPAPPPPPAAGACAPHSPARFPRSRNRLAPPAPPRLLRRMRKHHSTAAAAATPNSCAPATAG